MGGVDTVGESVNVAAGPTTVTAGPTTVVAGDVSGRCPGAGSAGAEMVPISSTAPSPAAAAAPTAATSSAGHRRRRSGRSSSTRPTCRQRGPARWRVTPVPEPAAARKPGATPEPGAGPEPRVAAAASTSATVGWIGRSGRAGAAAFPAGRPVDPAQISGNAGGTGRGGLSYTRRCHPVGRCSGSGPSWRSRAAVATRREMPSGRGRRGAGVRNLFRERSIDTSAPSVRTGERFERFGAAGRTDGLCLYIP